MPKLEFQILGGKFILITPDKYFAEVGGKLF